MTLGERSLQREVLALFHRQADMLLPRIRKGAPAVAAVSAHTLKGSAVGIGAFKVARAAEAVERTQRCERDAAAKAAIDTLAAVLDEAKTRSPVCCRRVTAPISAGVHSGVPEADR